MGPVLVIKLLGAMNLVTIKSWLPENISLRRKTHFTTHLIHFGKPPSAPVTKPINGLIKLIRERKREDGDTKKLSTQKDSNRDSLLYMFRYLILAYDRHYQIQKYYRLVSKGDILIVDRYAI